MEVPPTPHAVAAGDLDSLLSQLTSSLAWEWHCSRWCSTLAELAFVSFETGRTTALASARQNGCIAALLLLKKQCSLQRAARRAVDAKGQPLCPAVARETRHRRAACSMSAVTWLAIAGGAVAPGLMAFGLFVWADAWTYSPLALNAFKCALGSSLFGVVVLIFYRRPMPERAVLWLAFSSLLGIVIADTRSGSRRCKFSGARRMIAIDALKPFVAAFMGYFLLGDAVPWLGYVGVVVCALGVYLLNVESAAKEEGR